MSRVPPTRKYSAVTEFKLLTKQDAQLQLSHELQRLIKTALPSEQEQIDEDFRGFQNLFRKYLESPEPTINWEKIEPLPANAIKDYSILNEPTRDTVRSMLNKLVVVKLNGGIGTTLGITGPMSAQSVRNDLTFLDLAVKNISHLNETFNADVPLVLMNSFHTDEDMRKYLRKYAGFRIRISTFLQSRYLRLQKDSLIPIATTLRDPDPEVLYPPGHGDFYQSFYNSRLLHDFISEGREFCFVSNINNLGATVDFKILSLLVNPPNGPSPEFVMEVTEKTRSDVKGGTLIQYEDHLRLLEVAQVPKDHVEDFKSTKLFKIFNTNNLWINLRAIESVVESGSLDMDIIANHKQLESGENITQLETAIGAAMKNFRNALGINVPRIRFTPVKTTSDLLLVTSNLYNVVNGRLEMNPKRTFPSVPLVKLGDQHFSKVSDFKKRFSTIPDILELDHLTVSGDVTFGRKVSLKGTVIIIANHGERIDIPSGSVLENKILSGNLRIFNH